MWNRRQLLLGAASIGLLPKLSFASVPTPNNAKFVLVLLRGGLDGLAAVPPHDDPDYERSRKGLSISRSELIDLDGFFGLHPSLNVLHPFWLKEELAIVHATSSPYRSRSHFDAQKVLENGTTAPHGAEDGWLNRALAPIPIAPHAPVAIGRNIPLVLRGSQTVSALDPSRGPKQGQSFISEIRELYQDYPSLAEALDQHLISQGLLESTSMSGKKASFNSNRLALASQHTGQLLASAQGPNIAVLELSGFDTHIRQGTTQGPLANRLELLGEALKALHEALEPCWSKTTITVVTEFGRTVSPNGSYGTDHGTASVAFLLGGAVNGGTVITDWPGLSPDSLYQGRDLKPTIDIRSVFRSVLHEHLLVPTVNLDTLIFPQGPQALPNLIRTV